MCANVAMGLLAELHLLHLLQRGRGGGGPVVRARAKHFPGDYHGYHHNFIDVKC